MEEKLYFKPANYGKGKKKEQTEQKSEPKTKTKQNHKALKLVIVLLILAIVVAIIIWLLHGKTTTTGQYPANVKNEYLDCASNSITYPKVGEVDSDKKELKATMVFLGQQELSSISIKYTLMFSDEEKAHFAEPIVNTRFHENIAQVIDQYSAFNNKVTLLDDTVIVTLHASKNDLVDLAKEFFMINKNDNPVSLYDFKTNFESQGFACKASTDNN